MHAVGLSRLVGVAAQGCLRASSSASTLTVAVCAICVALQGVPSLSGFLVGFLVGMKLF